MFVYWYFHWYYMFISKWSLFCFKVEGNASDILRHANGNLDFFKWHFSTSSTCLLFVGFLLFSKDCTEIIQISIRLFLYILDNIFWYVHVISTLHCNKTYLCFHYPFWGYSPILDGMAEASRKPGIGVFFKMKLSDLPDTSEYTGWNFFDFSCNVYSANIDGFEKR